MDRVRPSGRVPAPVRVSSSPHPNTNLVPCLPPRISSISGAPSGDREDAGQRSAGDRSRSGPRLLQPPLPGGKGDGRLAPRDRPVDSEHLHSTDTVQDGDCSLRLERCPRERSPRLPGLEGRVLSGARPSKFQKVSALCVTGDSVPVQGSLLRTVHCPPSLHESVRSCVSVGALSRDSASPLLGRLAGSGLLGDQSPSARPRPALVVSRSGDRGQQGEVGSHALTFCELSRDDDRHSGGQGFSLESESGEVPSPGGQLCKDELPPCSAVGGAPRTSLIAREAGSPRSSSVALHAVTTEDVLVSRGRSSRSPSRVDSGDSRGPVLVDRGVPSSPGGSVRDSSSGSSSVHGRLLCGLGRSPARPKGVREVVGGGANVAHQSSRDEGSLARTAIFSEDSQKPSSDGNVRQLDGSSVCQQARRNAFSFHVRADKSPSQMDRGHRCPFGSEIPARTEQRPSGSLKPSGSGHCYGVDSPPSGGEGTPELWGSPSIDLFTSRLNAQLPVYCSLVPDDQATLEDAFRHPWDNLDVYAFPPFALLGKVLSRVLQSRNCSMTLVAPLWADRDWFADLLLLLTHQPLALPLWDDVVHQPHNDLLHPGVPALKLQAWRLSSNSSDSRAFREERRATCPDASVSPLRMSTSRSGLHFVIGVVDGALLQSAPLFP